MDDDVYIEQIEIGPMQNYTYIVGSKRTREVALVDPAWNIESLLEHVESRELNPVAALVTHYHPDHIGGDIYGQSIEGLSLLLEHKGMKIYAHREEASGVKRVTGVSDSDIKAVDSGDTLFIQGCGRVDLPGADPDEMWRSLQKLADLPDDTVLFPGHNYGGGASASLADPMKQNPYLRICTLDMWRELMGVG